MNANQLYYDRSFSTTVTVLLIKYHENYPWKSNHVL